MPNWCENHVRLTFTNPDKMEEVMDLLKGPEDASFKVASVFLGHPVDRIPQEYQLLTYLPVKETDFSFPAILPIPRSEVENCYTSKDQIPQRVADNLNDLFSVDARKPNELRSLHWNTKWTPSRVDMTFQQIEEYPYEILYVFDTAWSPPEPIFRELYSLLEDYPVHIECASLELGTEYGGLWQGGNGEHEYEEFSGDSLIDFARDYFDIELEEDED